MILDIHPQEILRQDPRISVIGQCQDEAVHHPINARQLTRLLTGPTASMVGELWSLECRSYRDETPWQAHSLCSPAYFSKILLGSSSRYTLLCSRPPLDLPWKKLTWIENLLLYLVTKTSVRCQRSALPTLHITTLASEVTKVTRSHTWQGGYWGSGVGGVWRHMSTHIRTAFWKNLTCSMNNGVQMEQVLRSITAVLTRPAQVHRIKRTLSMS
ncbi:uncharacterized protein [Equus asinus]|uniref:uncharacterized protein n=1 Tax=Equus asinus TaxID=9793 RepID=UPI0038F81469